MAESAVQEATEEATTMAEVAASAYSDSSSGYAQGPQPSLARNVAVAFAPLDLSLDFLGSPSGSCMWEDVQEEQIGEDPTMVLEDCGREVEHLDAGLWPGASAAASAAVFVPPSPTARPASCLDLLEAASSVEEWREVTPQELHWTEWRPMKERLSSQFDQLASMSGPQESGGGQLENNAPSSRDRMTPEWLRERYGQLKNSEGSRPASRGVNDVPSENLKDLTSLEAFEKKLACISGRPSLSPDPPTVMGDRGSNRGAVPLMQFSPPPDFDPPICPEVT